MGSAIAAAEPAARAVFAQVDEALSESLSRLCFEGPDEALAQTANTQPAILAASIACFEAARAHGLAPAFVAGHSLGEYSALVAAGSLALPDAARIVRRRGTFMQEAVPAGEGAMAALLGMEREKLPELLVEAARGDVVEAANFNSPEQTVIAGERAAVLRAMDLAKGKGCKRAVLLPVSAPFHCRLMKPAADRLAPVLDATAFADLAVPLVANVDARAIARGAEAREALKRQVASPVLWQDAMTTLWDAGARTFVEVGPGKVLTGLAKRCLPKEARLNNVEDAASLEKTLAALGGAS